MKPLKRCEHVGCQRLIPYGEKYCSKHKKEWSNRKKEWSKSKWNYQTRKAIYGKYNKFYKSKRWTRLSRLYREENPLCVECLKHGRYVRARVADHIIPIRVDWSKRWDWSNLEALCIKCHNKKSQNDIRKYNIKPLEKN